MPFRVAILPVRHLLPLPLLNLLLGCRRLVEFLRDNSIGHGRPEASAFVGKLVVFWWYYFRCWPQWGKVYDELLVILRLESAYNSACGKMNLTHRFIE